MFRLVLLVLLPLALSEGIPKHLHHKLRKAHSFHDVLDAVHLIYHPEKTNSHIDKTFPTSGPRQAVRIMSGSLLRQPSKHRKLTVGPTGTALHDEIDPHTADHLSMFGSIRQGNDTCQLQSVCVPIPIDNDDPQIVIFPKCYEVMQCVGSCCESFENCHPHSIRKVLKPIIELVYVGNDRFMLNKTMNITMEEHMSCSCYDCGAHAPQCEPGFTLGPNCKCECSNKGERNNCLGNRVWDEQNCMCACSNLVCSKHEIADRGRCECNAITTSATRPTAEPVASSRSHQADIASLPKLKANVVNKKH